MAPRPPVIAFARTPEARDAVSKGVGKRGVRFCSYEDELAGEAAKEGITTLVWDAARDASTLIPSVAQALSGRAAVDSILIQVELSDITCRLYLAIRRQLPHAILCLRGFDSLETMVSSLCAGASERRGDGAIIERVVPLVPPDGGDILTAATMCGHRRLRVDEFAKAYGTPLRTIEYRLGRSGIVPPREVLGWMLALHSAWRLDILGWPPKRVAAAAGFSSTDRWASYIWTHVQARPLAILNGGGFEGLLDRGCRAIIRAGTTARG
jgi:hypothetical protein